MKTMNKRMETVATKIKNLLDNNFKIEVEETLDTLQEIEQTIEKINSYDFNATNLKVHDISYRLSKYQKSGLLSYEQEIDIFNNITHNEYIYFKNELMKYDLETSHIGNTSSFYFVPDNHYVYDGVFYGEKLESKLYTDYFNETEIALIELLENDNYEELTELIMEETEELEYIEEILEETLDNVQTTLDSFLSEIEEAPDYCEQAKNMYDFLEDYKTQENEYAIADDYLLNSVEFYTTKTTELVQNTIINKYGVSNIALKSIDLFQKDNTYFISVEFLKNDEPKKELIDTNIKYIEVLDKEIFTEYFDYVLSETTEIFR